MIEEFKTKLLNIVLMILKIEFYLNKICIL